MALLKRLIPNSLISLYQCSYQPFFYSKYNAWLDRRIPPATNIRLTQKNIFIFLSPAGYGFTILLILLLLLAINYQNSLIYAFTFLLSSIVASLTWLTFNNLANLQIIYKSSESCFAGETAKFDFILKSEKNHFSLNFAFPNEDKLLCHVHASALTNLTLYCHAPNRGVFKPGRFKLSTDFPSGLFRAWSWLNLNPEVIVYPKPIRGIERNSPGKEDGDELHQRVLAQSDELAGFRSYQAGDNLKQIYWKSLAKGQELLSKQYEEISSSEEWLDFDTAPGLSTEEKLSILAGWALDCEEQGLRFGLCLPDLKIQPQQGQQQLISVLRALALYDETQSGVNNEH